ncbi:MAG: sigma-70 family RNA polymerase sigma factor [Phycisphaerales bacterium]|nr:sigma-70 family RNA polymerase sigma factor [Phycisphaerales bacterium]
MIRIDPTVMDRMGGGVDLRRQRTAAMAEFVADRAAPLSAPDRELLRAIYVMGQDVSDVAALLGVSPRTLRRRVKRLLARISTREYALVQRAGERLPPTRRRVGTAMFIEGKSLRATSIELKLSLHSVRRHADAIRALVEGGR